MITEAIKIVKNEPTSQEKQKYYFCAIIIPTDAEDMEEIAKYVVDESEALNSIPLTVSIIGVGPSKFEMANLEKKIQFFAKEKKIRLKRTFISFVESKSFTVDTHNKAAEASLSQLSVFFFFLCIFLIFFGFFFFFNLLFLLIFIFKILYFPYFHFLSSLFLFSFFYFIIFFSFCW